MIARALASRPAALSLLPRRATPSRAMPGAAAAGAPPPPDPAAAATDACDKAAYDARWQGIWAGADAGGAPLAPGEAFDAAGASPALLDLLARRGLGDLAAAAVLVPGCGRGYDVAAFALAGAPRVLGLELAPGAVAAAAAHVRGALGAGAGAAEVRQGDFFAFDAAAAGAGSGFSLGYDYTFLCALHPSMRRGWAAAWSRLLAPGGRLVALVFPVGKAEAEGGPPWGVSPELYVDLLEAGGAFRRVALDPVPLKLSHPKRAGKEYLGIWERTEAAAPAAAPPPAAAL
jgi:SAM-dependent methyltransferase